MSDGTFVPSGVTPWSSYNTPRIWAMVENEDDPESWRQVAALGSMAGLLNDQRKRLELAKEALIEAWPPGKSMAATVFVDMIDDLLVNMSENKSIAESNAGALGQVLEALRQAKVKIEPLYRSYLEKSDDWVPGWWDHAEDELDDQARQHMREAEQLVAHPDNAITAPSIYEFQPDEVRSRSADGPGADGPTGQEGSGLGGSIGAVGNIAVPHEPPPPLSRQDSPSPIASGRGESPGPSLAEVIAPAPGAPANPPPSVVSPINPSPGSPPQPGLIIGGRPLDGSPGRSVAGSRGSIKPFGGGVQRGLPSGAVIGNGPLGRGSARSAKPATPSWLPQASGQAARGGGGAHRAAAGAAPIPAATGRSPGRDDQRTGVSFEPDNPWATAQGVAPVIEPSRKRYRHDPGPGVIGRLG